jgi:hypothetical protein
LAVAIVIAAAFIVSGLVARSYEGGGFQPEPTMAQLAATPKQPVAPAAPDEPVASRPSATPAQAAAHATPAALAATSAPATSDPYAAAGMIVGKDPETGRIGKPTPAQRAEIERAAALASPALDRSGEGLTVVHRPDGSKIVDLQGRFQEYTVVRIGPDGKKSQVCVQGPDVEAALTGSPESETESPAPAAPKAEVR